MDWLADKKDSPWDPHDARGYETAAHFFMLNRRYPEVHRSFTAKPSRSIPSFTPRARRWAINLMRLGQDEEA